MLESRKLSIMKVLCSRWKQKMPKITFCWSLRLRRFLTNPKIYLWWPWFPRQLLLEFFLHFFFVWLISDPFEWSSYVSNNWPARKNYGKVQKWKNSFSFGYKGLQDVPTGHIFTFFLFLCVIVKCELYLSFVFDSWFKSFIELTIN